MKKKFLITILLIFVFLSIFISSGCGNNEKMLTRNFNQINNVKVMVGDSEITYKSDTVEQIFGMLQNTKVKLDNYNQSSEPKFILIFEYKDGTSDIIRTTENGKFFYRYITDTSWIGGINNKILPLINTQN